MPWTRLHRDWLEDYDFTQLSMTTRGVYFCLHMLAARSANRVPLDYSWIGKKIVTRPQDVGKAIAALQRVGLVEEFVEDVETCRNNDLQQVLGTEAVPVEIEKEKDLEEGPATSIVGREKAKSTRRANSKQPAFEAMTRACVAAGVRGSDYVQIGEVIQRVFGFEPSDRQLTQLERQIINRRSDRTLHTHYLRPAASKNLGKPGL
ncbi:MAG: hypothetical protein QNJ14_12915 [Woeseiaceae bacterium]|nr:hypothetical protein [Woeseiaceae bacterium]